MISHFFPIRCAKRMFVIGAITALVTGGATVGEAASWYEETEQRTISVEGEKLLVLITQSGNIVVTGEKGRGEIALRLIKKVKADDADEAKRLASMLELEITRRDHVLRISTEYPKQDKEKRSLLSYLLNRYPRMQLELILSVPDGLALEVETASGDVSIDDMQNEIDVTAASGDVEMKRIGGTLAVHVASGDIDITDVAGNVKLVSASGDVKGRNIAGDCVINTTSGDIDLSGIDGDLELRSVTGDATIDGVGSVEYNGMSGSGRFIDVRGGVSASAASGDLSLQLVPAGDFDYTVRTSSGGIEVRFLSIMAGGYVLKATTTAGDIEAILPINISKVGRNHVTGIVRDGRSRIILETASGDISISEPEE